MTQSEDAIQTRRQYVAATRRSIAREYDLTLTEVARLYPDYYFVTEWWDYVEAAFNGGADFTQQAIRTLSDAELRGLSRTTRGLRDGLPQHYLIVRR